MQVSIPAAEPWSSAIAVAERLIAAGSETYLVGGCVRDLLLGRGVKDVDVATAAHPEQVEAAFAAAGWKTIAVGKAFGVVVVVAPSGLNVEVATFRNDGQYVDGRRPSAVSFSTAAEDVARRDFTINALLLDPRDGRVVDHVGGLADLQARVLRAVGDAAARLREDRLRVLRALRFAAHLGLTIEPATWAAIQATELTGLSGERLMQEWDKGLAHHPDAWLCLVVASGRLAELCPPLAAAGAAATARAAGALAAATTKDDDAITRSAVALIGCDPSAVRAWLEAQPLPRNTIRTILWLLSWTHAPDDIGRLVRMPLPERIRALRAGDPYRLIRVLRLAHPAHPDLPLFEDLAVDMRIGPLWKPRLRAADLQKLGIPPGPLLGRVLRACEDAELENPCMDHASLLALAARLAGEWGSG